MRFKQFLNENTNTKELLEGLQLVYTNCMPYIKDLVKEGYSYIKKNQDVLYSGKNDNNSIITKTVRTDRNPMNTEYDLHLFLDRQFYKKFKIKPRSSAVFCSGAFQTADGYGTPYLIFPVNKYQIIWSNKIRDLYLDFDKSFLRYWTQKYHDERSKIFANFTNDEIRKNLKKYPYEFLILPDNNKFMKSFVKDMEKEVFSTYQKGNLMDAIKSKHEIMVICKSYIGLKHSIFNRVVKQYIDQNKTTFPTDEIFYEWYHKYIGG